MKKSISRIILSFLMVFAISSVYAQEWTKTQQEVLTTLEEHYASLIDGDVESYANGLHEKYQHWDNKVPIPVNKTFVVASNSNWTSMMQEAEFYIMPAKVTVTENTAIVYYFFYQTIVFKSGEGEEPNYKNYKGQSIDVLVKEKEQWKVLCNSDIYSDETE